MSFSSEVKEELSEQIASGRHCRLAETAAILSLCGKIVITENDRYCVKIQTENLAVARKYFTLLRKTFNIRAEVSVRKSREVRFYSVIVSKRATQMLVSHAAFLAKVSPEAANRLVALFEETANSLATMPERCSWLIADYIPPNKYRKILFEKRYLLLFQIIDNTVYVDYVVDCRQDYGWLLR